MSCGGGLPLYNEAQMKTGRSCSREMDVEKGPLLYVMNWAGLEHWFQPAIYCAQGRCSCGERTSPCVFEIFLFAWNGMGSRALLFCHVPAASVAEPHGLAQLGSDAGELAFAQHVRHDVCTLRHGAVADVCLPVGHLPFVCERTVASAVVSICRDMYGARDDFRPWRFLPLHQRQFANGAAGDATVGAVCARAFCTDRLHFCLGQ